MSNLNPFTQPIPSVWREDRELRSWVEYLNRFLHDIWVRTGGGDDAIANLENNQEVFQVARQVNFLEDSMAFYSAELSRLKAKIQDLENEL